MTILPMSEHQMDALALLEQVCFEQPWSKEMFIEELENPQAVFLVATQGDEVIGYIGSHFVLDEGYITNVAVLPQKRRQGAAKILLSALIEKGKVCGLSFLTLEARVSNHSAIGLYTQFGFEKVGTRKNYYNNPKEDAVLMTSHLSGGIK